MRVRFVCALALGLLFAVPAAGSSRLSERAAMHALRADLSRSYGIRHVTARCHRKSSTKFSCSWRGRRSDGAYRGRATVTGTAVTLTEVRKA